MSRTPARFTQADVARSIRAAKQAGAGSVELRPDGTIPKSPKDRMASLQQAHATELELLVAVPERQLSEADAHARFQHLRLSGEWFRPGADLLEFIKTLKPKPTTPHEPLIEKLSAIRRAHGSKSAIGHHCSNIVELLRLPKPPADLLKRQMAGLQRAWDQLN